MRILLACLLLAAGPATAQTVTLVRQTAGDYAFHLRVDNTDRNEDDDDCTVEPERLFTMHATDTWDCGNYRPWLVLLHRGVAIDSVQGMQSWLGAEPDTVAINAYLAGSGSPADVPIPNGAILDLTGDGIPEVILSTYSGGIHCCTTHWVVSLGDAPRTIGIIEAYDSESHLEDLDGDGLSEILLNDFSYAYWNTSFAGSPAPAVVIGWDGEGFSALTYIMQAEPMPADELESIIQEIRSDPVWSARQFPPETYWGTLLDLIYAGRGIQAQEVADRAWNEAPLGRRIFLAWLSEKILQSPYGSAVYDMNPDAPDWLSAY